MVDLLEEVPAGEILLSIILLKEGKCPFLRSKLEEGLGIAGKEIPRLKSISPKIFDNTFYFYSRYLVGEFDQPEYCLSREGKELLQPSFDAYEPDLQQRLKEVAKKVWDYSGQ